MSLGQERLKVKQRVEVDSWSVKEQLCLAAAVLRNGDQNWMTVSRMLRPFGDPNRSPEWYSQKNCAVQYSSLLENVETPKRKKRNEKGESQVETPSESIFRKLTQERIEELKRIMQEKRTEFSKLKEEAAQVKNGYADDKLDELCQQIDEEKIQKEKLAEAHALWLKEREKMDVDRTWKPPVAFPHRRKINRNVARRNSNQSDPNSEVDSAQDSPLSEPLNVDVINEDTSEVPVEPKPTPPTPTSPLLTSLLKSPSPAPTSQSSSILHSAITSNRGSSPTITSLLNSAPGIPVSSAPPTTVSPSLKNLVTSAISGAGTDHPPAHTPSPAAGAPTLSMLLELPPSLPGKPLPELPSTLTPPAVSSATEEVCHPQHEELRVGRETETDEHVEVVEVDMSRPKEEPVELLIEEASKEELCEEVATAPDSKNEDKPAEAEQPEEKVTEQSPEKEQKPVENVDTGSQNVTEVEKPEAPKGNCEIPAEEPQQEQNMEAVSAAIIEEPLKEAKVVEEQAEENTQMEVVAPDVPDLANMEVIILGKSQELEDVKEFVEEVAVPEETGILEQKCEEVAEEHVEIKTEKETENPIETTQSEIAAKEEDGHHHHVEQKEDNVEVKLTEEVISENSEGNTELIKDVPSTEAEVSEETAVEKDMKRNLRSSGDEVPEETAVEKDMKRNLRSSGDEVSEETAVEDMKRNLKYSGDEVSEETTVEKDMKINLRSSGDEVSEETAVEKDMKRNLRSSGDAIEEDTSKLVPTKERKKETALKASSKTEKATHEEDSTIDLPTDDGPVATPQKVISKDTESESVDPKENLKNDEPKNESASKDVNISDGNKKDASKEVSKKNLDASKEVSKKNLDASKEVSKKNLDASKEVSKKNLTPKGNSSRKESMKETPKKEEMSKEKTKKDVSSKEDNLEEKNLPVKDDCSKTPTRKDSHKKETRSKRDSKADSHRKETKADNRKRDSRSEANKRDAKEDKDTKEENGSKEEKSDECKKENPQKLKGNSEKEVVKDSHKESSQAKTETEESQKPTRESKRRDSSKESNKKEVLKKDQKEENKREIMRRSVSREEKKELPMKEESKKNVSGKDRSVKDTSKTNVKEESTDEVKGEEKKGKKRPLDEETKDKQPDVKKKNVDDENKEKCSLPSSNGVKEEVTKKEENLEEVKPVDSAGTANVKPEKVRPETPSTEDDKTNDAEPPRSAGGKKRLGASTPSDSVPNSPAASMSEEEREYRVWKKSIMLVYGRLATHKYASLFLRPITDDQAPGYSSLIHRPIDLLIIKKNIETGVTRTTTEFQRDVMLMFCNSLMYNKTSHFVHGMASYMQEECLQHIQDFLTAQMLVQTVGETPQRRETRTTEANKHKDLQNTPNSSFVQDEGESTTGKRKRVTVIEPEKSSKKRKIDDSKDANDTRESAKGKS